MIFFAHRDTARGDDKIGLRRHVAQLTDKADKVVGTMLQNGELPAPQFGLLVSGRASFELMQKALVAGMPLLAAVGAPSSLAVKLANEFGLTLVGFLKRDRFNVYSGRQRITD